MFSFYSLKRSTFWLRCLAIAVLSAGAIAVAADTRRRGATETALDRYVSAPDATFAWKKIATTPEEGATSFAIDMTSQQWLTNTEVNRTAWRHWLLIVRPDNVTHSTALLFISGGSNTVGAPPKATRGLVDIAKATGSVVAELRMIPNQTLEFGGDGRPRKEDDLIAYSWDKYLRTGDERRPARLPMTKAAVRAMDAAQAFLSSADGGAVKIDGFVVSGASKRGWTTWTTAIVDRRVVAICPIVIDVLNAEVSMLHHYRAYGTYSPAVGDYVAHGILEWIGSPESKALYAIEDPLSYRDRLIMPKLMMNACGDEFFLPDSSRFYFNELPGVKYLRYIPNTNHSLRNSDAFETLQAWHHAILNRTSLPQLTWKQDADGTLTVNTSQKPRQVLLWQANNPNARDFRLDTIGPTWSSSRVEEESGVFRAKAAKPTQGWSAYLMELTFDIGAGVPLKLTTNVTVTPDTLPFPEPQRNWPKGFSAQ
jgi:PhoPQ-activated pathogenicity-related protein